MSLYVKITWDCMFPENIPITTPTTAAVFELRGKWGRGALQRGNLKSFRGILRKVVCIVEVVNSLSYLIGSRASILHYFNFCVDFYGWPYKMLGFDNSWGLIISIIFMILAEFMRAFHESIWTSCVVFNVSLAECCSSHSYSRAFHKPFITTHHLLKFCDSCKFSQVFAVLLRFFYKAFAYS